LDFTTAVYVEKLNRIYILGGKQDIPSGGWNHLDGILYIDLPPPPTPTPSPSSTFPLHRLLNCSHVPSEVSYPHPTDTASFIICRNSTDYEVFTCPRTLLFDRKTHTCNAPEYLLPKLSCVGKAGAHPYPGDTSKFIVCRRWSPLVDVYNCPKPLHFYPETGVCAFQERVNKVQ
jgi:hypothetical protein